MDEPGSLPGLSFSGRGVSLSVLPKNPENAPLNCDLRRRNIDWLHLDVCRLQSNSVSFRVEALQGCFAASHQSNYDLTLPGSSSSLHEDIVAINDVLIAHG